MWLHVSGRNRHPRFGLGARSPQCSWRTAPEPPHAFKRLGCIVISRRNQHLPLAYNVAPQTHNATRQQHLLERALR